MKFSIISALILYGMMAVPVSLAMPIFYGRNENVEVRPPPSRSELEVRGTGMGGIGEEFGEALAGILTGIIDGIADDKFERGEFTSHLVEQLSAKDPTFNYVVCHTEHTTAFDGTEGTDWGHSHQEFDIQIGGTIGYEVYYLKSGKFTRVGDGGYLNWAYIGNVVSKSDDGMELTFAAPGA